MDPTGSGSANLHMRATALVVDPDLVVSETFSWTVIWTVPHRIQIRKNFLILFHPKQCRGLAF